MINVKEENKNKKSSRKEETNEFLGNQKQQQQLENATTSSTIADSKTTDNNNNKIDNNINNDYQKTKNQKEIFEKSIDTSDNYQQETTNTIQSTFNNYAELQNNILNAYQSVYSRFLENASKTNWNIFRFSTKYATDAYNKNNDQNMTDHTINCTQKLNYFAIASTENFNKSIEIAQKYYDESFKNYFNFINKIGRSYYYNQ